jgi:hypothetical protein
MNDQVLEAAFRATRYCVDLPAGTIELRVGESASLLDDFLRPLGHACWSLLSADNPGARQLAAVQNAGRDAALRAQLDQIGACYWRSRHFAVPADSWPPEQGVLVAEMALPEAFRLAVANGQLAILCGRLDAPVELRWLTYDGSGKPVFQPPEKIKK